MLSSTTTASPTATSSPGDTGIDTTTAGAEAADHTPLVARDPVGDTVDLDQEVGARSDGDTTR